MLQAQNKATLHIASHWELWRHRTRDSDPPERKRSLLSKAGHLSLRHPAATQATPRSRRLGGGVGSALRHPGTGPASGRSEGLGRAAAEVSGLCELERTGGHSQPDFVCEPDHNRPLRGWRRAEGAVKGSEGPGRAAPEAAVLESIDEEVDGGVVEGGEAADALEDGPVGLAEHAELEEEEGDLGEEEDDEVDAQHRPHCPTHSRLNSRTAPAPGPR